jgi:hypothetical protein
MGKDATDGLGVEAGFWREGGQEKRWERGNEGVKRRMSALLKGGD